MSFASDLQADRRNGAAVEEEEWHSADPGLIEEVIGRMDQKRHTETTLTGSDWWFILIGGGAGAYVVSIENQMTGALYQLVDPTRSEEEKVGIVAGGQRGEYPGRLVVDRETATRATLHFADTGNPDPSLTWVAST